MLPRIQLALNVSNIDESVEFYTKMFGVEPVKRRDSYANYVVDSPPVKLVLIQGEGTPGSMNHLGVEMGFDYEVGDAIERFKNFGFETVIEDDITCCYAVQNKVWVNGPDGEPWEHYIVKGDAEVMHCSTSQVCAPGMCQPAECVPSSGCCPE